MGKPQENGSLMRKPSENHGLMMVSWWFNQDLWDLVMVSWCFSKTNYGKSLHLMEKLNMAVFIHFQ